MIKWLYYTLEDKKKSFKNQFTYSDYLLKKDSNKLVKEFFFRKLKKNELYFTQFKYFKDRLNKNSVFLCSGYGLYEYFLKKKFKNFIISDSRRIYQKFNLKNKLSNFKLINVLKYKDFQKIKFIPKNIILNNVEYLFDNKKLLKCFKNIYDFSSTKTNIYIIFRSRYYPFLSFFDKYLIPSELYLKKIYFFFLGKKKIVNQNQLGFRRSKDGFENLLKKHFKILECYEDLFTVDYNRSIIVNKFCLAKILKNVFFNSHPYLHIYKLRKN